MSTDLPFVVVSSFLERNPMASRVVSYGWMVVVPLPMLQMMLWLPVAWRRRRRTSPRLSFLPFGGLLSFLPFGRRRRRHRHCHHCPWRRRAAAPLLAVLLTMALLWLWFVANDVGYYSSNDICLSQCDGCFSKK